MLVDQLRLVKGLTQFNIFLVGLKATKWRKRSVEKVLREWIGMRRVRIGQERE